MSWSEIECTERNGPITSYIVEFQEVEGVMIPGLVAHRTFTANGLFPYTYYTFRVAGVNEVGTGPFSNRITIRIEGSGASNDIITTILITDSYVIPIIAPGPVINLAGTVKYTSIVLTWSPPIEPNGVIISYEVTYTVNGTAFRVNTSEWITTLTIESLTPETIVSAITVTAFTGAGRGESANIPDQTTYAAPSESLCQ